MHGHGLIADEYNLYDCLCSSIKLTGLPVSKLPFSDFSLFYRVCFLFSPQMPIGRDVLYWYRIPWEAFSFVLPITCLTLGVV